MPRCVRENALRLWRDRCNRVADRQWLARPRVADGGQPQEGESPIRRTALPESAPPLIRAGVARRRAPDEAKMELIGCIVGLHKWKWAQSASTERVVQCEHC